jgi:hypothetical protein
MLNGAPHPLKKAAFEPFKDEFFDDILVMYRALKVDVQALNPKDEDEEEKLGRSVENLSSGFTPTSVGEFDDK